jgi:ubiquinone/menaquinone biosynthesis C-methylase UbiE
MFSQTAQYYDLIYSFKDYQDEATKITNLIRSEHPAAQNILDVACGTAEHAKLLSKEFQVDGIDLEPAFVKIAKEKVPSGNFWLADMTTFAVPQKYDVIQCLFSSIGYLHTKPLVTAGLERFKTHLNPNGIIIVEPWLTPEKFEVGHSNMRTVETDTLKICRANITELEGNISHINFHYLIVTNIKIDYLTENHALALYSTEEMLECFEQAGLQAKFDPEGIFGRGLYIARVKP